MRFWDVRRGSTGFGATKSNVCALVVFFSRAVTHQLQVQCITCVCVLSTDRGSIITRNVCTHKRYVLCRIRTSDRSIYFCMCVCARARVRAYLHVRLVNRFMWVHYVSFVCTWPPDLMFDRWCSLPYQFITSLYCRPTFVVKYVWYRSLDKPIRIRITYCTQC